MDFRPLDLNVTQGLGENNDIGIMGMVGDGNTGDLFQTIYPLSKIDIFIIRAYKIITKESILNSTHIQESLSSGSKGGVDKGDGRGMIVHPQYATTFNKISKIFNVLLNKGSMGEESASKKSPIELFHRFQQIIKEIELNFDNCSYSKYFNKINDIIFQIRDSRELRDDPHWKSLSDEILSVYNPRTGKMINQNRKKNANGTAKARKNTKNNNNAQTGKSVSNNSNKTNSNNNNNNSNNNSNNDNNNNDINNNNRTLEDDFINMTTDLLNNNDTTLSNTALTNNVSNPNDLMTLQRKLNTTLGTNPADARTANVHGFYTQPTSPTLLSNYPFPNLDSNATNRTPNMDPQQNQMLNINLNAGVPSATQISNHRKRRSLGSVNLDTLEDTAMDEILKYTNLNKRPKQVDLSKSNKPTLTTLLDNTPNSSDSTVTTTNVSNQSQLHNINSTNNTSVADDIMNKFNVTDTLSSARNNLLTQQMTTTMNNTTEKPNSNVETNTIQEIKKSYSKVLNEKDKRIQSLENEITLQRQESMWLRKLLIEDVGCIRNQLKDITHR